MEQNPTLGDHEERQIFQKMTTFFDAPAFIRRATRVEEAERLLMEFLDRRRRESLEIVRLRVGQLLALADSWAALRPVLATDSDLGIVRELHEQLDPRLRLPVEPTQ